MVQVILWAATLLALAGNVFVIRRQRAGFVCWAVTDVVLTARNAQIGEWAQMGLFVAYLGLAVWGFVTWGVRA